MFKKEDREGGKVKELYKINSLKKDERMRTNMERRELKGKYILK